MALTCMDAIGTGSLVFIDDVMADRCSRVNSKVYRTLLSVLDQTALQYKWIMTQSMVQQPWLIFKGSGFQAVIDCKRFTSNYQNQIVLVCPIK